MLEKLEDSLSEKEVVEMIRNVDFDGDGKIDYEDFVQMLILITFIFNTCGSTT